MSSGPGFDSIDDLPPSTYHQPPQVSSTWLPNAIACLCIGGHSIIAAIHPVTAIGGIICGILALKKYRQDKILYDSNPIAYQRSFKFLKAGRTTAIIGIWISAGVLVIFSFFIIFMTVIEANQRSRYNDYDFDRYDHYDYNDFDY